ncbi:MULTISPECIES: ETEC_3214 domain-containing protein [unclassified Pseudoalteromonas]|uniref:ETEC_3214 domain-containing protein n=1 Tax=unclassified Pseudoalteromonas TaxID=194690 RepID=UPI00140B5BD0|nr:MULTISPECIES: ETEC_3214 domain-containing protein [unclassified Pseudoalteromonas]MBH0026451.1 hypothetical protein [Pseudoalteromonas sp. SWN29]MBH0037917.1 hypothetical protein [Pseudoalteromonas sp. SWN166]
MSVGNNLEPEANTEENKSLLAKLKGYFILLMVTLMGLGNWADSKALIIEGYDGFVTHFTNQIEEKKITALDIGNYLPYAEKKIGIPQVIKTSSLNADYEYRYYKNTKYLLTLINKNTRIVGIAVHSLKYDKAMVPEFTPLIPFNKKMLRVNSLSDVIKSSNEFYFDSHNIKYYMQSKQLNAQGMFLNLSVGFSNYAPLLDETQKALFKLDELMLTQDDEKALAKTTEILANTAATFYAVSELSSEYISDSLLTKYEFNAYF